MSDPIENVIIKRERSGYRGQLESIEIVLQSRAIQLPGRKHFVSGFWSLVLFFSAIYAVVALGLYFGGVRQSVAAVVLSLMLIPFGLLACGALFGLRGFRPRDFTPLRKPNPVAGKIIHRPSQRVMLGAKKSSREVYEGDAVVLETVIELREGLILRVRDDDGKDDLSFDTRSCSLVQDPVEGVQAGGENDDREADEQLLFQNVARDEFAEVAAAIREALQILRA